MDLEFIKIKKLKYTFMDMNLVNFIIMTFSQCGNNIQIHKALSKEKYIYINFGKIIDVYKNKKA